MHRIAFILCSVLFSMVSSASDLVVGANQFKESLNTQVPVSGRVLTGVALSGDNSSNFSINLPSSTVGRNLCFRVISQDGTYSSENVYTINNVASEAFSSTDYPSNYKEAIAKFSPQELSLLASPGDCANKAVSQVYLSARGSAAQTQEATLFVSSGRSDVFLRVPNENGKKKTLKCSRIEEGARTAYDTLCKIEFGMLSQGTNQLSLMRRKSGRTLPPYNFEVLIGP